jgi:hypothetical protein
MNEKQIYEMTLQARLDVWSVEIEDLKARAESADADMRVAAEDKITELRARQTVPRELLAELRAYGDEDWKHLKTGVDNAANSLNHALRSIRTRL